MSTIESAGKQFLNKMRLALHAMQEEEARRQEHHGTFESTCHEETLKRMEFEAIAEAHGYDVTDNQGRGQYHSEATRRAYENWKATGKLEQEIEYYL